jgi:Tol biopolymer transport system component
MIAPLPCLLKNYQWLIALNLLFVIACGKSGHPGNVFIGQPQKVKLGTIPTEAEIVYHQDGFIYVMDRSGGNITQVTFENPRVWEHVAVSPDKNYIVANEQDPGSTAAGGSSKIWLFDLKAGTEAKLLPYFLTAGNGGVDWDKNGFIYFAAKEKNPVENPITPDDFRRNAGANDIYRIKYDGSGLQRLLNTPNSGEADVSVAEDGSMVAFVLQPVNTQTDHTEIWMMNSNGTNPQMIYKAGQVKIASAHDPEFSPDNSKLIFSIVNSTVPPNFPQNPLANTAHDIWSINVDGTELKRQSKPGPLSIAPDWEGGLILYLDISEADQYAGISIINPNSIEQTPNRMKPGANIAKWIP